MPAFFTLTLDTTAPVLNLQVASWGKVGNYLPLSLTANETLDGGLQDVTLTDSAGTSLQIVVTQDGDAWRGLVDLTGFATGQATITARMADEVGNVGTASSYVLITAGEAGSALRRIALEATIRKQIGFTGTVSRLVPLVATARRQDNA